MTENWTKTEIVGDFGKPAPRVLIAYTRRDASVWLKAHGLTERDVKVVTDPNQLRGMRLLKEEIAFAPGWMLSGKAQEFAWVLQGVCPDVDL